MIIDRKFEFMAINPCNSKHYNQKNAMVFCAKDRAVPVMIKAYIEECKIIGCGTEHIESMQLMLDRVVAYQKNVECRTPDTETECEIDRCIGNNV